MDENFNQYNNNQQTDYSNQYAQNNQQPDYTNQYAQYNQQQGYTQYNAPQNNYNEQYNQQYNQQYGQQPQNGYVQPEQYNAPYYNQQYPQYVEKNEDGKGMSIASLVLGILSVSCCCGSWIIAILGLVFGIISKKKQPDNNGMAVAGIVLSAIGIALSIFTIIAYAVGLLDVYFYNYMY